MCRQLPPTRLRSGGRPYTPVPDACNESGREEEEDMFTVVAMLTCRGRWWGDCNDDDGKEEEMEEDDNGVTIAALGAAAGKMVDSRSPQGGWQRRRDGWGRGSR